MVRGLWLRDRLVLGRQRSYEGGQVSGVLFAGGGMSYIGAGCRAADAEASEHCRQHGNVDIDATGQCNDLPVG